MPGIDDKHSWSEIKVRIKDPGLFIADTFRRKSLGDGIFIVIGQLKDDAGAMVTQAYRFDKKRGWTIEKVRSWLVEHSVQFSETNAIKDGEKIKRFYLKKINKDTAGIVNNAESDVRNILVINWLDITSFQNGNADDTLNSTPINRISIGIDGGIYKDETSGLDIQRLIYLKDHEWKSEDFIDIPLGVIIKTKIVGSINLDGNIISDDTDEMVLNNENRIDFTYTSHIDVINCDDENKYAEVELLREGQWAHKDAPGGILKVSKKLIKEIIENFNKEIGANTGPKLPLDYRHQDNSKETPGWIVKMSEYIEGGISRIKAVLHITDAADLAAQKSAWTRIKEGSLQFISPSIALGWINNVDGRAYNIIRSAALTNYPHIKGMSAIAPINLEELTNFNKEVGETMNLEQIKKLIETGNINLEDLQKVISAIIALESPANEKLVLLESAVKATAVINNEISAAVSVVKSDLEKANVKITDLEEQLKTAQATINNSTDANVKQVETLTAICEDQKAKITAMQEQLPGPESVVISKAEYLEHLVAKKGIAQNVAETIIARVSGTNRAELDKSFDSEHKYIQSIQEMIGKTGNGSVTGSPRKSFGSVDVSNYVNENIAKKMQK